MMNVRAALKAIDREGVLLVFPIDNRREPASLWSAFYPKAVMRWEWDKKGDDGVAHLWPLRRDAACDESAR